MIEHVFLLPHTHVDFGYTDNRDKVCDNLVGMIDEVTDLGFAGSSLKIKLRPVGGTVGQTIDLIHEWSDL